MGDRLPQEYCITPGSAKRLLNACIVELHSFDHVSRLAWQRPASLLQYTANGTLEAGRFEGPTPPDTHPNTAIFLVKRLMILAAMAAMTWTPPLAAQAPQGGQLLRSGDVIRLNIWREPDMSGEYVIDEAGSVIFPRVGEYFVLEEDNASLEAKLLADYLQYLRNPSIEVTVLRRVSIIGAVNDPGQKLVDPTVTIADALAMAGGATTLGDQNKIRIIRDGVMVEAELSVDTRLTDSTIRSGDQIFVPERPWLSRNTGVVATGISASVALIIALFIR